MNVFRQIAAVWEIGKKKEITNARKVQQYNISQKSFSWDFRFFKKQIHRPNFLGTKFKSFKNVSQVEHAFKSKGVRIAQSE